VAERCSEGDAKCATCHVSPVSFSKARVVAGSSSGDGDDLKHWHYDVWRVPKISGCYTLLMFALLPVQNL